MESRRSPGDGAGFCWRLFGPEWLSYLFCKDEVDGRLLGTEVAVSFPTSLYLRVLLYILLLMFGAFLLFVRIR